MEDKKVASIFYSKDKSIDFFEDRLTFNNKEIKYDDVVGYGYLLSTHRQTVNFIPIYISKTVKLSILLDGDSKPTVLTRKLVMPYARQSKQQKELDNIFMDIARATDSALGNRVLQKLSNRINQGDTVSIGGLVIGRNSASYRGGFTNKVRSLDSYGRTFIKSGLVVVENAQGKHFFETSLGDINAPLLGPLLDALFKK